MEPALARMAHPLTHDQLIHSPLDQGIQHTRLERQLSSQLPRCLAPVQNGKHRRVSQELRQMAHYRWQGHENQARLRRLLE